MYLIRNQSHNRQTIWIVFLVKNQSVWYIERKGVMYNE